MANNPKKELLEWLALKPRTQGWGAVVAYDRSKCNTLLLQDYINKFTTDSYLPPIDEPVATGDANWQHMHDWVTDVPRLSFENSSRAPGGSVNMKMAVVGGTQVSIDEAYGPKRAIAIKSLDALDHPELIAENVYLSKTNGTVGKDTGEVVLDLGDPKTAEGMWELTFANTQHERRIGGAFFKKYYKEADEKKRLYHLGKIAYTDQQYLKPKSFQLRTMTAKGAESITAENFGDGTVEMFVCMEGDREGGTPPIDDWKSLIPNDVQGQYDSAILLSNKIVMHNVLAEGVKRLFDTREDIFEAPPASGFTTTLRAKPSFTDVMLWFQPPTYRGRDFRISFGFFNFFMETNFALKILQNGMAEDQVLLDWAKNGQTDPFHRHVVVYYPSDDHSYIDIKLELGVNARGKLEANSDAGTISLKGIPPIASSLDIPAWNHYHQSVNNERQAINAHILAHLQTYLVDTFKRYFEAVDEIDIFVLNSILFGSGDVVKLKSVSLPGDLITFGQISAPFTVVRLEHLMGHGATHEFEVSKDFTGKVEWSVAPIPGSTGGIGSINKNTGVYTAPSRGDIDGTFTRVRVTATDPVSKYSSSALVTVVVRDITINPVVQICNASEVTPITRTLSANTLGAGILEWKVKRGAGTIPQRAGPDGKNTYTAGPKNPDIEGTFTIDEIEVKNLATNKTQSSYVVVNHYSQELKVTIDMNNSSFPNGKAKLIARDNRDRPVSAEWEVTEGNGRIDSDGLYTGDVAGQQRFALITARTASGEKDGWIILPWPLFELPDKPENTVLAD